ncbi:MAG: hypothetical protein JST58_05290 [Bacteroidetes bacterium]|nr:hypothetical protein [Bacteroidota bacterium]
MKFALERLGRLVSKEPVRPQQSAANIKRSLAIWKNSIKKELGLVHTYIQRHSLGLDRERSIKLFMHQYQLEIVSLLDVCYNKLVLCPDQYLISAYLEVLGPLMGLLDFFRVHYGHYFDEEQNAPRVLIFQFEDGSMGELKALRSYFGASAIDPQLIEILFSGLSYFSMGFSNKVMSFRDIRYQKNLVKKLTDFCEKENPLTGEGLCRLLCMANFNSLSFFDYQIGKIVGRMGQCDGIPEKIDLLNELMKETNQMFMVPDIALFPNSLSLKEQVANWIAEELFFLEKKSSTDKLFSGSGINISSPGEPVHVGLSVDSLSVFIRAARDAGMITNQNQTALLKTVSQVFRTPHSERISAESLRNKFYSVEKRSKERVEGLLYEMLKHLKKYCIGPLSLGFYNLGDLDCITLFDMIC